MFGRRVRLIVGLACFPLLGVGLAPGCGQGEGDRCEIDSDCKSDLKCDLSPGRSEGICRSEIVIHPPDAGADRPIFSPDAAVDVVSDTSAADGVTDATGADHADGASVDVSTDAHDGPNADGAGPG